MSADPTWSVHLSGDAGPTRAMVVQAWSMDGAIEKATRRARATWPRDRTIHVCSIERVAALPLEPTPTSDELANLIRSLEARGLRVVAQSPLRIAGRGTSSIVLPECAIYVHGYRSPVCRVLDGARSMRAVVELCRAGQWAHGMIEEPMPGHLFAQELE